MFLNHFNILISKIIYFLKNIYYFNKFIIKGTLNNDRNSNLKQIIKIKKDYGGTKRTFERNGKGVAD